MSCEHVQVKRIYDEPDPNDGVRILVDRVWPRGVAKADAHIEEWLKDVAPSTELRRWYGHDLGKFAEFRHRYRIELGHSRQHEALLHLKHIPPDRMLTLLTATKDVACSHAAVLAELLRESVNGSGDG